MQLKYYLQFEKKCLTVLNSSKIFFDVLTKNNVSDSFQMLEQNNYWKICKYVYVCIEKMVPESRFFT